jgi:hypothetical protein
MSRYEDGVNYTRSLMIKKGFDKAKTELLFFVENSIDFNNYDDFDRGIQAELKRTCDERRSEVKDSMCG